MLVPGVAISALDFPIEIMQNANRCKQVDEFG
jgi:hypothetical protein